MKAIILAGGLGTRLRTVVKDLPKSMAPVNGRPFLELLIERLVAAGVIDIILSVGYLHESIIGHFGDGSAFRASISYCVEREPLGTGGAIRESMKMAEAGDMLILNGDTFAAVEIRDLVSFHTVQNALVTMAVVPVHDSSRYGSVIVSPEGRVTSFVEKSKVGSNFVNSGMYVCHSAMLDIIPFGNVSFEKDILPVITYQGRVAAQIQDVPFIDIGVPEDYRRFCLNHIEYTKVKYRALYE